MSDSHRAMCIMQEPSLADQGPTLLSGGSSAVQGDEIFDEEISIVGNRVIWSAAGIVRRRFTLQCPATRVLQASPLNLASFFVHVPHAQYFP